MKKNSLRFTKLSGAGNDFIVVDLRSLKKSFSQKKRKEIVKAACDRHYGVGADGLLFLEKAKNIKNDFRWDFYNRDGSRAEMCLNASRCVVRYELQKKKNVKFESIVGLVTGKASGKDIQVELPIRKQKIKLLNVRTFDGKHHETDGYAVNSGVPHFVVHKKFTNLESLRHISSQLRFHKIFNKPGSNVTYWEGKSSTVKAITFERGVEDFTLACGTGAVAVGMVFEAVYEKTPITVQMPGGKIKVDLKGKSAIVTGSAEIICEGELCLKV
ncbi:MAG: diaminopimelate epimerase [Bdellovibrionota bacterium]